MVIHIEVGKSLHGLELRIGDCEEDSAYTNFTKEEVLEEIKDVLEDFDDGHDSSCEGSLCYCKQRRMKYVEENK